MQVRAGVFSIMLMAHMLTQEYIVDSYVKVETGRLSWQRFNQNTLRADQYRGLQDAANAGDADGNELGRRVILSSSFIGGPRHMRQLYQDAMAVVAQKGRPDLFITLTTNANWPEIVRELLDGQTASDRPDLVARVFRLKVKALIRDIVDDKRFGDVLAYSYVIEFQKRGLPHMHLVVTLRHGPATGADIDKIVCAEIPDPELEPELHAKVAKHMMHGPCGAHAERGRDPAPCVDDDDNCKKKYPKMFVQETVANGPGGYPIYRRRDDGRTVQRAGRSLDNRWVVPYNRALLTKYNAHINVEVATGVACVKYLYKYIMKGHDRGLLAFGTGDEINQFVDGRYVSGAEGCWRLFHNPLAETRPNVVRLQIHLEGEHIVRFEVGEDLQQAADQGANQSTTLLAWFKLNRESPDNAPCRAVPYPHMPTYFTYAKGKWSRRVAGQGAFPAIGRMYQVWTGAGEKYYLRLLLTHVTGARSYEDVRTADGVLYDTFREAALARGLLRGDEEWARAMQEATEWQMPSQLRSLFVSILVFCAPANPVALWDANSAAMSEDFLHTARQLHPQRPPGGALELGAALRAIEAQLQPHNKTLLSFGLPPAPPAPGAVPDVTALAVEERRWDQVALQARVEREVPLLNVEQREAYDAIMLAVHGGAEGGFFFLDAMGGCGKTFVLSLLLASVRQTGGVALACATSGLAALLLEGGTTAHSRFKLPLELDADSVSGMTMQHASAALLRAAKIIVWDEAPMAHKHALGVLDRLLRDIMGRPDLPFGGKVRKKICFIMTCLLKRNQQCTNGTSPTDFIHECLFS